MTKRIKRIKIIKINETVLAVLMVIALCAGLLPLYRLGLYACPYWDDYSYGYIVRNFLEAYGPKGFFPGVFYFIKVTWYAWQGTYGSAFFMSMSPVIFGEEYYFLGVWANITMISIAGFVFPYNFTRLVSKASKSRSVLLAAMVDLFLIELINTAHQGFYWVNGATHYTFMYGLLLFMLTAGISLIYSDKRVKTVLLLMPLYVLAVAVAGSNFVATLQGGLALGIISVWAFLKKSKNRFLFIPSCALYGFGMFMNIAAPGNSVREMHYNDRCTEIEAVLKSFKAGFDYFPQFTGLITIVMVVVFVPVLWNIVVNMNCKFRLPVLVTVLSFCLYSTGFTPSLYGMGFPGLERTINNVKWTMQILMVINEAYWIGWIVCKLREKGKDVKELSYNVLFYLAGIVLVFIVFITSSNQAGSFSSYGAYYYIHTGEAYNYRAEYLARIEIVKNSPGQDVVVEPHYFRPWLLCGKDELDTETTAEQNMAFADFYRINSIRIRELED